MYTTMPVALAVAKSAMEFRKVLNLSGPNIWARTPMLEAWVDLSGIPSPTADQMSAMAKQLRAWLPGLEDRLPTGHSSWKNLNLAEVLQLVTLELHTQAGWPISQGSTLATNP